MTLLRIGGNCPRKRRVINLNIFVTGFHRAGTHSAAQDLAQKHDLSYIDEFNIGLYDFDAAKMLCDGYWPKQKNGILKGMAMESLKKGFVLQCPGIAHKTIELANLGKVYWCERDKFDTIASMHNSHFHTLPWKLMNFFHDEFANDEIWETAEYHGEDNPHGFFTNYYQLFYEIKEYFYNKYFKDICEIIKLEDQNYFDEAKTNKDTLIRIERKRHAGIRMV